MNDRIIRDAQITNTAKGNSTTTKAVYIDGNLNRLTGVLVTEDGHHPRLDATLECKNGKTISGAQGELINRELKDLFRPSFLGITLGDAPQTGTSAVNIVGKGPMAEACSTLSPPPNPGRRR